MTEFEITHKCLVSYSIGDKYKDEVWWDESPMDVGHVLLGRPWVYERDVTYRGKATTYSLMKDGSEITLYLIKKLPGESSPENCSMMVFTQRIEEEPPNLRTSFSPTRGE